MFYTKYISSGKNYLSGFAQHTYVKNNKNRKNGYYYSKHFYVVNCDEKTYATPSFVAYGFKNEVVDSYDKGYLSSRDFERASPDTISETIVNYMCAINEVNQRFNNG